MRKKLQLLVLFIFIGYQVYGQTLVYDIQTGSLGSVPENLIEFNDTLYFTANDGIHGKEIWKYDGINTPTLVADINPGAGSMGYEEGVQVIEFKNRLVFNADNGTEGEELWEFDGTNPPSMTQSLRPGTSGSIPYFFTEEDDELYFRVNVPFKGVELASYNGVDNPAVIDLVNGSGGSYPNGLESSQKMILFESTSLDLTGGINNGLYKYDITLDSVIWISKLSHINELTPFNNKIIFRAQDYSNRGIELHEYNFDSDTTRMVMNISSSLYHPDSNPHSFYVFDSCIFFSANDGIHGYELWKYDGLNSPSLVKDIRPGSNGSNPQYFVETNNQLFFIVESSFRKYQLWYYDKKGGVNFCKNILSESSNASPKNLVLFNNKFYLSADDGALGQELWELCIPTYKTINEETCHFFASPSGKIWTKSGIYTDTIPNTAGCDSIITIELNILNSDTTVSINSCDSLISPSGKYKWTTSGNYIDTILNAAGCDSIITIDLTVNGSTTSTIAETACDNNYTSPSGKVWTVSDTYMDTIPNAAGCDSIITIDLTVNSSTTSNINETVCDSYTSPSGKVWTVSDTYVDTIPNAAGCDSIITIDLTINTVDTSVTQNGNILTANATGAFYRWLDCTNGYTIIVGETNQSYTVTQNGNYAVEITQNACIDTSACFSVTITGILENTFSHNIVVFPNPTNGAITINLGETLQNISVILTDLNGKQISQLKFFNADTFDMNLDVQPGIYLLTIKSVDRKATLRLIKK